MANTVYNSDTLSENILVSMDLSHTVQTVLAETTDNISSNVTQGPTLPPNPDVECKTFVFILYVVIFGSMCIFGFIGNTLSFLVLQWEKRSHVATFLLRIMALVDNFYLLIVGFSTIFSAATVYFGYTDNPVQPYMMVIVWPLVYIAQMSTVWITVLIAFNRYIAICKPFQAPQLCTMRKTRAQIILMTLFIIVYNVPRFFEWKIVTVTDPETGNSVVGGAPSALKENKHYNIIYENLLYCLFIFFGPLVILIFFNACLIRELMAARRRLRDRHLPVSGEEEENNLTLVMIIIILMFLSFQTPAFLNQLLYYLLPDSYQCGNPYFYFYNISNVLASANSCFNFVIYCAFRKQFRTRLHAFCCRNASSFDYSQRYSVDGETVTMYINNNSRSNSNATDSKQVKNGSSKSPKSSVNLKGGWKSKVLNGI